MSEGIFTHETEPTCETQFRADDETPVEAVVRAVAAAEGVRATDLPPLYGAVEVDALESLLAHAAATRGETTVEFEFLGHQVGVSDDGRVVIAEN